MALTVTGIGLYVVAPSLLSAFGAWPQLAEVRLRWFVLLAVLEAGSFAALWWLTRLALEPHVDAQEVDEDGASRVGWGTVATAQLAGSAASKVVPGGAATGGVVQARLLIQAGEPAAAVASALTGVGLITTAVLLLLPVLTVPALLIGPPPAEQLQLGLLVSLIVAVVIVAVGVVVLTWPRVLTSTGRLVGHVLHQIRPAMTAESVASQLSAQRARVVAAFQGRWWLAVVLAAANRMFDYAALVAALAAFGVHARPSEVLLAFVVAQALTLVPITPGGLGFVESGLTALLVVIGVPVDVSVIATLLYRLVSYWLPIPIGALAWAGWRLHAGRTG